MWSLFGGFTVLGGSEKIINSIQNQGLKWVVRGQINGRIDIKYYQGVKIPPLCLKRPFSTTCTQKIFYANIHMTESTANGDYIIINLIHSPIGHN